MISDPFIFLLLLLLPLFRVVAPVWGRICRSSVFISLSSYKSSFTTSMIVLLIPPLHAPKWSKCWCPSSSIYMNKCFCQFKSSSSVRGLLVSATVSSPQSISGRHCVAHVLTLQYCWIIQSISMCLCWVGFCYSKCLIYSLQYNKLYSCSTWLLLLTWSLAINNVGLNAEPHRIRLINIH